MQIRYRTPTEQYLLEHLWAAGYRTWLAASLDLGVDPKALARWRAAPLWSPQTARQVAGLVGRPTPPELTVPRRVAR